MTVTNVLIEERLLTALSDFEDLVEERVLVDKSQAIVDFLSTHRPIHLALRPRRSGKSTTLSMFKLVYVGS